MLRELQRCCRGSCCAFGWGVSFRKAWRATLSVNYLPRMLQTPAALVWWLQCGQRYVSCDCTSFNQPLLAHEVPCSAVAHEVKALMQKSFVGLGREVFPFFGFAFWLIHPHPQTPVSRLGVPEQPVPQHRQRSIQSKGNGSGGKDPRPAGVERHRPGGWKKKSSQTWDKRPFHNPTCCQL